MIDKLLPDRDVGVIGEKVNEVIGIVNALLFAAEQRADNSASDEIAFLEKLQKCYFDTRCIDCKNVGFIMLTERIKQLHM